MKKILIVEDDNFKAGLLISFLQSRTSGAAIFRVGSVASGKNSIRTEAFDLIVLDMSLPAYDIDSREPGGTPQVFGGRELLAYIDFLEVTAPVIIVTQFERFGSGGENTDINALGDTLGMEFPLNYGGIVHFSSSSDRWMTDLEDAIVNVKE